MFEPPFLYDDLLHETAAGRRRQLLCGGRGMGKTTFLRRLRELLVGRDLEVVFLSARSGGGDEDQPLPASEDAVLLVDDVDRLKVAAFVDRLHAWCGEIGSRRFVLTSGRSLEQMAGDGGILAEISDALSGLDATMSLLSPYEWGWRTRLVALLGKQLSTLEPQVMRDRVIEAIVATAGGRPDLTRACVEAPLLRLPDVADQRMVEALLTTHLWNDAVAGRLRRTLEAVSVRRPEVTQALVRAAQAPYRPTPAVRARLVHEGWAASADPPLHLMVPSRFVGELARELFPDAEEGASPISVRRTDGAGGLLILSHDSHRVEHVVVGHNLKILELLLVSGDRIVPYAELERELNKDRPAVAKAVSRLKRWLKGVELGAVAASIVVVRNQGYTLRLQRP